MAVDRVPVLKRCRSLDMDPVLVGINKKSRKVKKRQNKKLSEYGMQLREKQRVKFIYGVLEKQFRLTFAKASNKNVNLLVMLECRLDSVAFRLGFAATRRESRQVVTHGHLLVNGKTVDIPSYEVKVGDVISVKEKSSEIAKLKLASERAVKVPEWLEFNKEKLEAKVVSIPTREQIDIPFEERLIVELYSKN